MVKILLLFLFVLSGTVAAQETAKNLFSQYRNALFQIQMIDKESGNKTSIGSGFQINQQGELISNYHVVSSYIYNPDKYHMQYLDSLGNRGALSLLRFDVVNDLALLKIDDYSFSSLHFELAPSLPEQGASIFSLGNPHDLGMIVVPGTFNGLKKNSFYQRIHFTGSINPGMSGGPAVNDLGQVVGVNVATAGNQIGFLIPLPKILALAGQSEVFQPEGFKQHLQQQLYANQSTMVDALVASKWQTSELGKANVPDNITDFISCWGGSNASDKKAKFLSVANRCRLGDRIFLNNDFQTGEVEIEFEWLQTDELNTLRFYNFISQSIANAGPGNKANKTDVSNYTCREDLLTNANDVSQKAVMCLRAYHDFDDLFDVLFISATTDFQQSSLISHFTLSGVSQQSAQRFSRQFMDSVSWQ